MQLCIFCLTGLTTEEAVNRFFVDNYFLGRIAAGIRSIKQVTPNENAVCDNCSGRYYNTFIVDDNIIEDLRLVIRMLI